MIRKLVLFLPLAVVLAMIGVGSFAATSTAGHLVSVAHAGTLAAATPADTGSAGLGIAGYLLLAVAVIGGALRILDVIIPGLKWLAPRTATKLDDGALDLAEKAHDRLDDLEQVLTRLVPADPPKSQSGFIRGGALAILAALGLTIAASCVILGCGPLSSAGTTVKALPGQVVSCAKADVSKVKVASLELAGEALGQVVTTGALNWEALKASAESKAGAQGLDVAACSFGALVAQLNDLFNKRDVGPKVSSGGVEAFVDVSGGSAALAAFSQAHGVTRIDQ